MRKLTASIYKEFLLLIRDKGGLAVLFIMPSVLIIIVTLIQNSTFKAVGEAKMPIVWVDNDKGEMGKIIQENLNESGFFEIITREKDKAIDETEARRLVSEGQYQIAIVIPSKLSQELNEKIQENVEKIVEQFSLEESDASTADVHKTQDRKTQEIKVYFDPAAGQAFRNSVKSNIDKMIARVESQKIYQVFQEQMDIKMDLDLSQNNSIAFQEIIAQQGKDAVIPNAVQHNVPAWSLFGIFFIIIPLATNIVKEKNSGTYIRLRTSPVSYTIILGGKIVTYSMICLLQFALMLLIGKYIFPLLGLIEFEFGHQLTELFIIAFCSGLAAIGLGVLIGTIARTQEQTAPFASILIIILAALGGVWVPTFIMPEFMQKISAITPMNWALSSFYDVILRNSSLSSILINLSYLLLFSLVTLTIAVLYHKKRNTL